jgi:hypothetical protein
MTAASGLSRIAPTTAFHPLATFGTSAWKIGVLSYQADATRISNFNLFRNLQGVVDFDAKVADLAL